MKSQLIDAIRTGDSAIAQLFEMPFNNRFGWISYLYHYFGDDKRPPYTVKRILDLADRWHSDRFQALYVACWVCHPVEKGSYMIRLSPEQKALAQSSADQLTWRISSHLSATSRSARAGEDMKFIKGYGELLVIVQDDDLFLKMEGHNALSWAHMRSWVHKIRTGEGETANAALNALAKRDPSLGIQSRRAENFSVPYKALIKALGLSGNMVSFSQVYASLRRIFPSVRPPANGTEQAFRLYFSQISVTAIVMDQARRHLVQLLDEAQPDLLFLAREWMADARRAASQGADPLGVDRIFREIRLSPDEIDDSMNKFLRALWAPDLATVVQINGA